MFIIPQYEPLVKKSYATAVYNQITSGLIGPGNVVAMFEDEITRITGLPHVISVNSATSALMLGIMALDLKPGSTVVYPAYGYIAGANTLRMLGYKIKLADVNLSTMCLSVSKTSQIIKDKNENISAVFYIDHNGYTGSDLSCLKNICQNNNIPLIEDSAVAFGVPNAGHNGEFGVFSFSVPKIVTTGQGGVVVTKNTKLAKKVRELRDQGDNWRIARCHVKVGGNFCISDITASYGLPQLYDLDILLKKRRQIWNTYLKYGIQINNDIYNKDAAGWCVTILTEHAEKLIAYLSAHDIQACQLYKAIYNNPAFADLKDDDIDYPNAECLEKYLVYLPSSLTLTDVKIRKICEKCRQII